MTTPPPDHPDRAALVEALRIPARQGAFGPRSTPDRLVEHAGGFVAALRPLRPGARVVDVGAGGGIPGLVIAVERPDLDLVLVDRRESRTDSLRRLVRRLGVGDRVRVVTADARHLADERWTPADAAVARGFAGPLATLEVAVPLVRPDGGLVVISDPPDGNRWDDVAAALERLAVEVRAAVELPPGAGRVTVLRRST